MKLYIGGYENGLILEKKLVFAMQINKIEKIILGLILLRNILKNIPKQNQNYIDNQLELIYDDFMR